MLLGPEDFFIHYGSDPVLFVFHSVPLEYGFSILLKLPITSGKFSFESGRTRPRMTRINTTKPETLPSQSGSGTIRSPVITVVIIPCLSIIPKGLHYVILHTWQILYKVGFLRSYQIENLNRRSKGLYILYLLVGFILEEFDITSVMKISNFRLMENFLCKNFLFVIKTK